MAEHVWTVDELWAVLDESPGYIYVAHELYKCPALIPLFRKSMEEVERSASLKDMARRALRLAEEMPRLEKEMEEEEARRIASGCPDSGDWAKWEGSGVSADTKAMMEAHLAQCEKCQELHRAVRETSEQ